MSRCGDMQASLRRHLAQKAWAKTPPLPFLQQTKVLMVHQHKLPSLVTRNFHCVLQKAGPWLVCPR